MSNDLIIFLVIIHQIQDGSLEDILKKKYLVGVIFLLWQSFESCNGDAFNVFMPSHLVSNYRYYLINQFSTLPFTQTVITSYAFLYITHFYILTLSHFKILHYFELTNKKHVLAKCHPTLCLTFLYEHKVN